MATSGEESESRQASSKGSPELLSRSKSGTDGLPPLQAGSRPPRQSFRRSQERGATFGSCSVHVGRRAPTSKAFGGCPLSCSFQGQGVAGDALDWRFGHCRQGGGLGGTGVSPSGKVRTGIACQWQILMFCDCSFDRASRCQTPMRQVSQSTLVHQVRGMARHALRGVRVGEASNPGPPKIRTRPRLTEEAEDLALERMTNLLCVVVWTAMWSPRLGAYWIPTVWMVCWRGCPQTQVKIAGMFNDSHSPNPK